MRWPARGHPKIWGLKEGLTPSYDYKQECYKQIFLAPSDLHRFFGMTYNIENVRAVWKCGMSSSVKTGTWESAKYKLDSVTDGTREVLNEQSILFTHQLQDRIF